MFCLLHHHKLDHVACCVGQRGLAGGVGFGKETRIAPTVCLYVPPDVFMQWLSNEDLSRRLTLVAACPLLAPLGLDAHYRIASALCRVPPRNHSNAKATSSGKLEESDLMLHHGDTAPGIAMDQGESVCLIGTGAVRITTRLEAPPRDVRDLPRGASRKSGRARGGADVDPTNLETVELGVARAGDLVGLWHLLPGSEGIRDKAGVVHVAGATDGPLRRAEVSVKTMCA